MKLISCFSFAVLLCTGISGAQTTTSPVPEDNQIARYSKHQPADLATRSEMQQPRPIPIVNPLRFPEIPVVVCSEGTRFAIRDEISSQLANPSQTDPAPRSTDCAALPNEAQLLPK
jgi:hypothetical protein